MNIYDSNNEINNNCEFCKIKEIYNQINIQNFDNCEYSKACERFYQSKGIECPYYSCRRGNCKICPPFKPPKPCPPRPHPPKPNNCNLCPLLLLFLIPWLNYNCKVRPHRPTFYKPHKISRTLKIKKSYYWY